MTSQKLLLLIGATSDIGHAVALAYAEKGWRVVLSARDPASAERNRADVAAKTSVQVDLIRLDVGESEGFAPFVDALPALPDTVVCAVVNEIKTFLN